MKRTTTLILLCFLLVTPANSSIQKVTVDNIQRTFLIYQPKNIISPAPLVIVFHGGGNAEKMRGVAKFEAIAKREGFIVVYAQALKKHWNDGRKTTADGADDIAYVNAIIDQLVVQNRVDPLNVFATGISNGGFFIQRLACESSRFKAYASVVSTMAETLLPDCKPQNPVNLLMINGRDDRFVPWGGGEVKKGLFRGKGGRIISVDQMLAFWQRHNQCQFSSRSALPNKAADDGTRVFRVEYQQCQSGSQLVLLDITGGGHIWPGYPLRFFGQKMLGKSSQDINASEVIWHFFRTAD